MRRSLVSWDLHLLHFPSSRRPCTILWIALGAGHLGCSCCVWRWRVAAWSWSRVVPEAQWRQTQLSIGRCRTSGCRNSTVWSRPGCRGDFQTVKEEREIAVQIGRSRRHAVDGGDKVNLRHMWKCREAIHVQQVVDCVLLLVTVSTKVNVCDWRTTADWLTQWHPLTRLDSWRDCLAIKNRKHCFERNAWVVTKQCTDKSVNLQTENFKKLHNATMIFIQIFNHTLEFYLSKLTSTQINWPQIRMSSNRPLFCRGNPVIWNQIKGNIGIINGFGNLLQGTEVTKWHCLKQGLSILVLR